MRLLPLLLLGCPTVEYTGREHADRCASVTSRDADDVLPSGATVREVLHQIEDRLEITGPPGRAASLILDIDTASSTVVVPTEDEVNCSPVWSSYSTGSLVVDGLEASVTLRLEFGIDDDRLWLVRLTGDRVVDPDFISALTGTDLTASGASSFYACPLASGVSPLAFPVDTELEVYSSLGTHIFDVTIELAAPGAVPAQADRDGSLGQPGR